MVEDYAMNILTDLPPNALVLSTQWDYFVSASYYFTHVNNVRPDIVVLDKELFRRSWYFPQLKGMYPEVIKKSEGEYSAFMRELYKFEHDLPYDYNAIEGTYTALLSSFIEKHAPFPVFITPEIEPQYLSGYIRVPEGFLFRLTRDTTYQSAPFPRIAGREYHGDDSYTRSLRMIMRNALLYRASYERYYGKDTLSALFTQKASEFTAN
jgi:hypothetical protein